MGREQVMEKIESLKPVLGAAGRSIEIIALEDRKAIFKLSGFCGGCACSSSYMDGLRDLVAEYCPDITDIQFIEG